MDVLAAADAELLDENIQKLLASSNKKEEQAFAKVDLKQFAKQSDTKNSIVESSFKAPKVKKSLYAEDIDEKVKPIVLSDEISNIVCQVSHSELEDNGVWQ